VIRRGDLADPIVCKRVADKAHKGAPTRIAELGVLRVATDATSLHLTEELAKLWRRNPPGADVPAQREVLADVSRLAVALGRDVDAWVPATSYDAAWKVATLGAVAPAMAVRGTS
jgi:hypothetical protein